MLVQKRDPDAETNHIPPPTIRVWVKYGAIYHEININSQATFGESLISPLYQKLMYKDKTRDSKSCLDTVGVKDRSKIVLMEDPISQEKMFLEMRKNAKMEKGAKSISDISFELLLVCKEGIKGNGKEAITNFQPSNCGAYVSLEAIDEEASAHNLDLNLWNSPITDSPKANSQAQAFIWPNMYSGFNMISFFEM
ncbi:hypothetical protein L2E82_40443 [Cichorium intybus]|uniref:Uncharacterized protein n=1 Tax=Cichorium intybus TaxID=13427 RepID=A0ACB9AK99_CICIN|nr:hypothetical protein L2E82_40443 [Cichorium intybus]